jgi:hypothetical protein
MSTIQDKRVPPDVEADGEALLASIASGEPLDAEAARRIRERAEKVTQEIYRRHGLVDIAVPAIRELRGETKACQA